MKKCDVVMKGGITSGIVYPGAVCELAKEYRFASIGGTSAGAIAAALTAAAEYRRYNGSDAGFEELAALPAWLAGTAGERSRLLSLFQPSSSTRRLHATAMSFVAAKGSLPHRLFALAATLLTRFLRIALPVALIGILGAGAAIYAGLLLRGDRPITAVAMFAIAIAIFLVASAAALGGAVLDALLVAMKVLPDHGFGICSGRTAAEAAVPALTDWLAERIDAVAGVTQPLTFGDLWSAGGEGSADQRTINLEMMSTSLTHGRPYRLPFETSRFFFAESEMRRLFPERIVRWMVEHPSNPKPHGQKSASGEPLHRFPSPAELPIVVATRMSLSFPILLSAVPLHAIDFAKRGERRAPERCWFSDGGITSNFPVHFFDAPLPRWPTFAFNLEARTGRYHAADQNVYVPQTNRGGISEWWRPFTSLPAFLTSIVSTMQNWRDNMLLHLPGQRDRIAHVLLAPDEGGLNLTMDRATIEKVACRGAEAAAALRARFGEAPPAGVTLTWKNHKWVRYLAFMPALEEALEKWSRGFDDTTERPAIRELLDGDVSLPSYRIGADQREGVRSASLDLLAHIQANFGTRPFRSLARRPRPEPALRAMPKE